MHVITEMNARGRRGSYPNACMHVVKRDERRCVVVLLMWHTCAKYHGPFFIYFITATQSDEINIIYHIQCIIFTKKY